MCIYTQRRTFTIIKLHLTSMLSTRGTIRYYSTRSIVDKWFNAIQSCEHDEQQKKLTECVESIAQENKINYPKLIQNIIHRWTIEQPSKDALWTYENDGSQGQKFTFKEIYMQSSDFARILTGKQFNLTVGENVEHIFYFTQKKTTHVNILNRFLSFYHLVLKNVFYYNWLVFKIRSISFRLILHLSIHKQFFNVYEH